ncbi:hypothetical protein IFM89_035444 [Coptis chinensis]|uniref:Uncharacterized protein n=1 Tax=Coptis chinensis TaxID=261450 RepID=A0A835HEQ8_9MAGN|nr:hypothetical protein IFM89_035444 [Coptis chinensis]
MSGGINQLKEHLVLKKGNVTSCPNVTIKIQKKINATLLQVKKKNLEKARIQDEDDEVDLEGRTGAGKHGEGSQDDDVNESDIDDIDIDIEAGDDQ